MPYVQVLCNVYIISVSWQFILIYICLCWNAILGSSIDFYTTVFCVVMTIFITTVHIPSTSDILILEFDKILITGTKELPVFRPMICVTSISSWCPGARQKIKIKRFMLECSQVIWDQILSTHFFLPLCFLILRLGIIRKYSKYISCNECFSVTRAR